LKQNRAQILREITTAILKGDAEKTLAAVEAGLGLQMSATEILEEAIIPATNQIAEKFQGPEFYIPEVLFASHAIKAGLYTLKPLIQNTPKKYNRTVIIGTVEGDIHDIGKNLVTLFLTCAGFEVIDLGVDVTASQFIKAIKQHKPDILALSALLTTTMGEMAVVIEELQRHNLRHTVKVLIGGGPVTEEFATLIGADAYAKDAREAVIVAKGLLDRKSK
jgi:methanogenic corrinoid protein MtbC1